ncbi:MAG TPA: ABC-three component system protein [Gemmataceae bacterium]|jgi:hypothetical protein
MSGSSSPSDASASALGYLYQCRYALLLALERAEEPNVSISIEKLDDVSFHLDGASQPVATELRQFKLHTNRQSGLGDKSPDIWKTLKIWAEAVRAKKIDLDRVTLCLVTTSTVNDQNAVRWLLPDRVRRNPEEARKKLEEAGADSTSSTIGDAFASLSSLSEDERKKLFQATYLLEASLPPTDLQQEIGRCLWAATLPQHREAFVERLEGWWINVVVNHLNDASPPPILLHRVQQQVHEIRAQFRRDCLPDDLFKEAVPPEATKPDDDRIFVCQLILVGLTPARLRLAQEDHYRAFTQRSRWVKQQLLGFDEEVNFEARLIVGWKERFAIMQEGMAGNGDETLLSQHGLRLYEWIVLEAPSKAQLWVRTDFQTEYMVKGSYHMLADQLRVGWHPHYEARLKPPVPAVKPAKQRKKRSSRKRAKP